MDEEDENSIFSDFQKHSLNQDYLYEPLPDLDLRKNSQNFSFQDISLKSRQPSFNMNEQQIVNQYPTYYAKAYNPMEMIEKMPPEKKRQYERIAMSSKNFNGLQFFFETEEHNQSHGDLTFLSGINDTVFNFDQQPKSGELSKLFQMSAKHESEKQQIQNIILQLRRKFNETQEKSFSSIMLNKTIGPAFYEHFENFSFVSNPSNFYQELESSLTNFINNAKKIKGPGPELIYSIYDFWLKTFKDFVNEIWKYSSKYTLNFLKKEKNSQMSDRSDSTTRKQCLKQKRKNWGPEEIRILERIIDSNVIFSQNKLKELSDELGRSVNSISSKIQKILKSKKGEQYQEDSLLKKTIEVLKLSPQGLNKQSIIEKINQYYEMGYDGQWEKSVGQLLSSRKEFNRIKGKYRLINGQKYEKSQKMQEENGEKLTFRDKVIKCLLKFNNYEADLKSLIETYISMYGQEEAIGSNIEERRKSIQASISKTLSRYDIFDTSNSKTIYQYVSAQSQEKPKTALQEYENFITM